MSLKSSLEFYKQAKYLYKDISDVYDQFQQKTVPEEKKETLIDRALNDINRLNNILNKVNVRDFEGSYSNSVVGRTEHNVDFYYEAADYIEKSLIAEKYYDSLLQSVQSYFKAANINTLDLKLYAKNEEEYVKKFVATILHPSNISQFLNQIKRMAIGTMSKNEFKKIYATIKSRMSRLPKKQFESFEEYKKYISYET
jgi:hypothetical protein